MNAPQNPVPDYKEMIRKDWTGAAPLWQKWNHKFVIQTRAATELVVHGSELALGMKVLDLASGTGEPALSLAQSVGVLGRIIATDMVPEMIEAARQNAAAMGLANMEFRVVDAESLPFSDGEFDRVTSRFGLMFFPDIPKAMSEIRRVLKPGGRFCFLVWATLEENPFFLVSLAPFLKRVKLPPPPPDAPHIFRFADQTKLETVLQSAGFRDVSVKKYHVTFPWPGSAEESWAATRELAAPFKKLIEALPLEHTDAVIREVLDGLRSFESGGSINLPATVNIAVGAA
jgi:ubiquinone/menaquinone biosynthesis C-methylase UbiE